MSAYDGTCINDLGCGLAGHHTVKCLEQMVESLYGYLHGKGGAMDCIRNMGEKLEQAQKGRCDWDCDGCHDGCWTEGPCGPGCHVSEDDDVEPTLDVDGLPL